MYGRKNIKCTTNYKKSIKNWGGVEQIGVVECGRILYNIVRYTRSQKCEHMKRIWSE